MAEDMNKKPDTAQSGLDHQAKRTEKMRQLAVWMPAIIVVLAIAYAVAAWFLLLKPKIGPLMSGGKYDFTQIEKRIATDRAYIDKVENSLIKYQEVVQGNRDKVANIVPKDTDFPSLMAQLESLAEGKGMQLTNVEANVSNEESPVPGTVVVKVSATFAAGSYRDLKSLLIDIQRSERLLDVREFSYSPDMTSIILVMNAYALAAK